MRKTGRGSTLYGGGISELEQRKLHDEVDQLRHLLDADYKNLRIVAMENKIRDNKRIIINYMTDNIF